jgi:hypothetical protein
LWLIQGRNCVLNVLQMDKLAWTFDVPSKKLGDINIEYAKYITFKDSGPGKTCHTVLACFAVGKQLLPLLMFRRKMGQKVMIC